MTNITEHLFGDILVETLFRSERLGMWRSWHAGLSQCQDRNITPPFGRSLSSDLLTFPYRRLSYRTRLSRFPIG